MMLRLLAVAVAAASQNLVRTDADFFTARDLWFSDQKACIATYGSMKDWDTSAVTDMSSAFEGHARFDVDIS